MPVSADFALVEAFCSDLPGSGNPAGVVLLDRWIPDDEMLAIASTVNQAETAFVGPGLELTNIRWFTPTVEVRLCGHATLAAATFLSRLDPQRERFDFESLSGKLSVHRSNDGFALDFPSCPSVAHDTSRIGELLPMVTALYRTGDDWMAVLPDRQAIEIYSPNLAEIAALGQRGLSITAPCEGFDFCYRFFAPQSGVDEDHATGSAQTYLVPYWANRFGKGELNSIQLSRREGHFSSEISGDRIRIGGKSNIVVQGKLELRS